MNDTNAYIRQNALKFSRSRGNLLAVTLFTLINVMLAFSGSDWYLLFSATAPFHLMHLAMMDAAFFGYDAQTIIKIILSFSGVLALFLFWLLSARYRFFILIAMLLFGIDTAFLIFLIIDFSLFSSFDTAFMLDVAFQAWVMFYLISGTIAWARLRGITSEQIAEAKATVNEEAAASALNELSNDDNKGDDK